MLKYSNVKSTELQDWDDLVKETYKRPYSLQQQDGCKGRGIESFTVPDDEDYEEYMNESIKEEVNSNKVGVKFNVWLNRDPNKLTINLPTKFDNELFWERNFYPNLQTLANDLYNKGLIEAGEYQIVIDW